MAYTDMLKGSVKSSVFYDKFFTLLAGFTLPTGDFDSTRAYNAALKTDLISTAPGMQQGAGTPT